MAPPRTLMPSIQELTAFEAAGRHGSFTRAAGELALTQSAVSKQVRELEATLGVVLFERTKGRAVLTLAGRDFLPAASRLLQDYATATHAVMASAGSGTTLRLGVLPTFAARWLVPRLPGFLSRQPGVTVSLVTAPEPFDLASRSVDAAIHFGEPSWPQAECVYLCDEAVIAVASPAYAERHGLTDPGSLARATLLQQASRPGLWRDWFARAGVEHPHPLRGPLFDQFAMTSEAAKAEMGVALLPWFLVERELSDGSLTIIPAPPLAGAGAYYVVVPVGRRSEPTLAAFVDWLVAEAAASARRRA
ncbi:LysR family transcriptional regulator [Methylobacterium oryzihabitans]|uniref:LysR family transcriptional regulator n=1 Tax=Methylobacterium oryzihabitans TaxID=2499852 RepID=A0A437NPJ3_9HYPH|nr:LysR family transcriptional regulator [Methylobacterium oryzihabitans]RVU11994.1 LysR family transcriptional regulator [Methylobacterium oryzihabitans]